MARVARQRGVEGGTARDDLLGAGPARRERAVFGHGGPALGLYCQGPGPDGLSADQVYRRGGEVGKKGRERKKIEREIFASFFCVTIF